MPALSIKEHRETEKAYEALKQLIQNRQAFEKKNPRPPYNVCKPPIYSTS